MVGQLYVYFRKSNIKEWWVSIVKSFTCSNSCVCKYFYWTHLFTLIRIFFKATCGLIPSTQLCRNFLSPLIVNTCVKRSDRNKLTFNFRIQSPKSLRQFKVQIFWVGHIFFSNLTILKWYKKKSNHLKIGSAPQRRVKFVKCRIL